MRKINFIKKLFNKSSSVVRYELIEDRGNGFYAFNGKLYKSDIVRACIRPQARAIGKLVPQHIRDDKVNNSFKVNPEAYIRFLLEEPNPYTTGQDFQEKLATQLELNNNAFALIVRDSNDLPCELYNIPCIAAEAKYDKEGLLYLKFTNRNGKTVTYPYKDIIHIRQDYNENDIFGTSPRENILPLMEVVSTTDQGIIKAIKNSSIIRWLLKFNTTMRPEDITKETEKFAKSFLNVEEGTGVAGVDSKADAKQIDPKDYVPNAAVMDRTTKRLYSFFNTNDKIVQSTFNEDEWNAYYESKIEPIAMKLSNEVTRKIFTRRERGFGNKIMYTANNLQYASMSTKLGLQAMVDRGAMTPNEWREVLNLPPVENGDKLLLRKDTGTVSNKATFANKKGFVNLTKFSNKKEEKVYAIDFDGTLCKNIYPKIGEAKEEVIDYVKSLKENGNKLILWTCRTGEELDNAIEWCSKRGLEFDAINENLEDTINEYGTDPRKISVDCYIDDKALNVEDI